MSFYDFTAIAMNGKEIKMSEYEGKVVIVVNTASKCGFTPQFAGLEELYKEYKDRGLVVLGFPCNQFAGQDPAENEDILEFCQLNYGVTFQMFQKINVNGRNAHPLYKFLKSKAKGNVGSSIKWNFAKFLVDKSGNVVKRFSPATNPADMREEIEKLL